VQIWDRVTSVLQWAAIGTGSIVALLVALMLYLSWQASRWFRAEFPRLPAGNVLTEEEQAQWKACVEKRSARGIYRSCEIAFVILGLPGMAMRSRAMLATGAWAWIIVACNAIGWFGILALILALREFGKG
jgi:hypothetical protein